LAFLRLDLAEAPKLPHYDLFSLRTPDPRPGTEDPAERKLIEALQGRALSAIYKKFVRTWICHLLLLRIPL
jgi:hypothetical protein